MRTLISLSVTFNHGSFYYCQVEQALNPSLREQAFAIRQKHIVVTANYAARAAGVKKLQLLNEAKASCPGLIIVPGEDIQKYRDASKAVFRHVRSLVGSAVQRLGMDELWIDITQTLETFQAGDERIRLHGAVVECQDSSASGHTLGDPSSDMLGRNLVFASHIAAFLRESIRSTFSFTSSGGVSTSKIFAKLVGDVNKPNDQTTIFPAYHQEFLDKVPIKKIAGVGYAFLKVLYAHLQNIVPEPRTIEIPFDAKFGEIEAEHVAVSDDDDDMKITSVDKEKFLQASAQRNLTVLQVRQSVNLEDLIHWFDKDKGRWLWNILHARDDSVLVESELYPKSIGVEDSFPHCTSIDTVKALMLELTTDLVSRMELDLKDEAARWVRFPRIIRLTPRFRGDMEKGDTFRHKRMSRSVKLPVDVFDSSQSTETRAEKLVNQILMPLFLSIISKRITWDLSLLNVGVAEMQEHRQSSGNIAGFLKDSGRSLEPRSLECPPGLDENIWNTLDNNLKQEIVQDLKRGRHSPEQEERGKRLKQEDSSNAIKVDEWGDDFDQETSGHLCAGCSSVIPLFAMTDHVCYTSTR